MDIVTDRVRSTDPAGMYSTQSYPDRWVTAAAVGRQVRYLVGRLAWARTLLALTCSHRLQAGDLEELQQGVVGQPGLKLCR